MLELLNRLFRRNDNPQDSEKSIVVTADERFNELINSVRSNSCMEVKKHIGNLNLLTMENKAYNRVTNISKSGHKLKNRLQGIIPLLETGEYSLRLFLELSKNDSIPSVILQPFCNANEIMLNDCFILSADEKDVAEYVNRALSDAQREMSKYEMIEKLKNKSMELLLVGYYKNRNLAAHTYQLIPSEAAVAFALRTYESIQRMDVILHPVD